MTLPSLDAVKRLVIGSLLLTGRAAAHAVCPAKPFYQRQPPEVGIEQEFNGIDVYEAAGALAPLLGPVQTTPHSWATWLGHADVPAKGAAAASWRAVPDVTLSTAANVELISPPLSYDETPWAAAATARLVQAGARTDSMAAMHVHVNHTSLSVAKRVELLQVVHRQGDMLMRLSRTSPRQACYFCKPLPEALMQRLADWPPPTAEALTDAAWETTRTPLAAFSYPRDVVRFWLVNAAGEHTLEFRQFDATTLPQRVQAFVDLSLALTTAVRDSDVAWLRVSRLDPDVPDAVNLFLDTIGLVGPRLAVSRAALFENARQARPFEWAEGELRRQGLDALSFAVLLGAAALRPLPGVARHAALSVAAALGLRAVAVGVEAFGCSNFELTHAARAVAGKWLAAQAVLTGAELVWAVAWSRTPA